MDGSLDVNESYFIAYKVWGRGDCVQYVEQMKNVI